MGIRLCEGFRALKPGKHQLLKITKVKWDEKFQKAEVTFGDSDGRAMTERYSFMTGSGQPNTGALGAFSVLVACATDDEYGPDDEFEPEWLVGLSVVADVVEQPEVKDGEPTGRVFSHLRNFEKAGGDDEEDVF